MRLSLHYQDLSLIIMTITYEVIIENTTDCPRYTGITISGITVGESPEWLKNRLRAVGLNPINNVVDITNFVQHEIRTASACI